MVVSAWMSGEEASAVLGVKPATLYAYVSRGVIRSERTPGERRSRFMRADVEAHLARIGARPGGANFDLVVDTALTKLDPAGALYYRGWDVASAAETSSFEAVASWLWTGEASPTPFLADRRALGAVAPVQAALPDVGIVDWWRVALPILRHLDPLRTDVRASAVADVGRRMMATLIESTPAQGHDPGGNASVAARLWARLTAEPPSDRRIRALDTALILLADHEMATSTLAARVAASTKADPYLVVSAGLAAGGGRLHGGMAEQTRGLIRAAGQDGLTAAEALGHQLARGRVPGLGHMVYDTVDPRTAPLLAAVRAAGGDTRGADALAAVMADRALPFPNIDFALAALGEAFGFADGATEAVFVGARIAGWLGHVIEEYDHELRYRTRASYVGPRVVRVERPATSAR